MAAKKKTAGPEKAGERGVRIRLLTNYRRGGKIFAYGTKLTVTRAELEQFPHLGERVKK